MKEKILDIAFKHFVQYGFTRTTLTGIAYVLGKKKTALYYYFKNKEDLFAAIVSVEAENLLAELEVIFKTDDDEITILKKYITARVRAMHLVSVRYKVLKDELFVLLPEIERVRFPYHQKEVLLVEKLLIRGNEKEIFKTGKTEHIAKVLVNTLKGLEIPMYIRNEVSYDPKEIDGLISVLIYGVATSETLIKI